MAIRHPSRTLKRSPRNRQSPTRLRSLSVLSHMRHGKSLSQAARLEHTTARTVRTQLGKQLRREHSGRYKATTGDTLRRELTVFGPDGYVPVAVRSSRQAELASRHLIAILQFLRTGDRRFLQPFSGKQVGGVELLTAPDRIREVAEAGALKLDSLYQRGGRGEQ